MSTVTLSPSELRRTAVLQIAGATCALHTNSQEILASTGPWQIAGSHRGSVCPSLAMKIRMQHDGAAARLHQPRFRGRHHLVFAIFGAKNFFVFDLLKRELTGVVSKATALDAHFWNAVLIPILMGVMGPSARVIPLHAACLVHKEAGVLITGASGAGKSTLSVALALNGMDLVSDDWTYIRTGQDRIMAYGLQAPVKLLPDAVNHFHQLREVETTVSMNDEQAYEVSAETIFRISRSQSCTPKLLLLLERTRRSSSYFADWQTEHVREYFLQNAERLPDELVNLDKSRLEIIRDLSHVPAFVFHAAGTPQESAQEVAAFLESI